MSAENSRDVRDEDASARRAAAAVFDRPIVLEAGAGTGKTATLVARIAAWALGPGWDRSREALGGESEIDPETIAGRTLERIAAITFTDRAATEMAGRVAEAFAAVHAGRAVIGLEGDLIPAASAGRAGALLAALDRFQVSTIHAFCRRLLAAHPLEAGLHPRFTVDADGRAVAAIAEEVLVERLPTALGEPSDPDWLLLARSGIGPAQLGAALESIAAGPVGPEAFEADPCSPDRVEAARVRFLARVRVARGAVELGLARPRGNLDKASGVLEALGSAERRLESATSAEAVRDAALALERSHLERLGKWAAGGFTKTEEKAFGELADRIRSASAEVILPASTIARHDPAILSALARVLAPLVAEVRRRLRARGIETFPALLADARDLLEARPEVAAAIRGGVDQLLVDECQDTDPVQYDMVERIALGGAPTGRPGLFLVGDPKQSIYGWRNADLEAYERFVQRVLAEGGTRHLLTVNFRSVGAVLTEVERLLEPILREEPGVQPPFQPLVPSVENATRPGWIDRVRRPVEHWISWSPESPTPRRTPVQLARRIEARAVARDIRDLAASGVPYNRVAILMRATSNLETYLGELREAGVPFLVERDRSYYRRREVIDAGALVRAVIDPNDHVALVAFLRSPVVGVPDAAWLGLWGQGFPDLVTTLGSADPRALDRLERIARRVAADLPAIRPEVEGVRGWENSLVAALAALGRLRESFATEPIDRFVEEVRSVFLSEALGAARFLGRHRLANLERFFRRLLSGLTAGTGGPHAVLRELRLGVAEAREEEEGAPGDETLAAVRVLTIHKAKGLTFDHVYVVDLAMENRGGPRNARPEVVLQDGVWELRLFGIPSLGWDRVQARNLRTEAAERVRTLYVAATRPAVRLVLAGRHPGAVDAEPVETAGSHADLLLHRRGGRPDLETAFARGQGSFEEAGALWRFPALEPDAFPEPAPAFQGGLPCPLETLRAQAERLDRARDAARARMARPFKGTASGQSHEALVESVAETAGRGEDGAEVDRPSPIARDVALATGTAVHRVLETLDLTADPRAELARQEALLPSALAGLDPEVAAAASEAARAALDRLARSDLLGRLRGLAGHVLGRELPVLLPGSPDEGPVGVRIGTIDLLYRDPATGAVVVADYKTDRVATEFEIAERAAAYAGQGRVYVEAVRRLLGDDAPVRFELWFLWADRVAEVTAACAPSPRTTSGGSPDSIHA